MQGERKPGGGEQLCIRSSLIGGVERVWIRDVDGCGDESSIGNNVASRYMIEGEACGSERQSHV